MDPLPALGGCRAPRTARLWRRERPAAGQAAARRLESPPGLQVVRYSSRRWIVNVPSLAWLSFEGASPEMQSPAGNRRPEQDEDGLVTGLVRR